jgi:hypothetical protein
MNNTHGHVVVFCLGTLLVRRVMSKLVRMSRMRGVFNVSRPGAALATAIVCRMAHETALFRTKLPLTSYSISYVPSHLSSYVQSVSFEWRRIFRLSWKVSVNICPRTLFFFFFCSERLEWRHFITPTNMKGGVNNVYYTHSILRNERSCCCS